MATPNLHWRSAIWCPRSTSFAIFVAAGGLTSWLASTPDVFSRATSQPNCRSSKSTKVELIINLKTAKVFGLTCRRRSSHCADEVIE